MECGFIVVLLMLCLLCVTIVDPLSCNQSNVNLAYNVLWIYLINCYCLSSDDVFLFWKSNKNMFNKKKNVYRSRFESYCYATWSFICRSRVIKNASSHPFTSELGFYTWALIQVLGYNHEDWRKHHFIICTVSLKSSKICLDNFIILISVWIISYMMND